MPQCGWTPAGSALAAHSLPFCLQEYALPTLPCATNRPAQALQPEPLRCLELPFQDLPQLLAPSLAEPPGQGHFTPDFWVKQAFIVPGAPTHIAFRGRGGHFGIGVLVLALGPAVGRPAGPAEAFGLGHFCNDFLAEAGAIVTVFSCSVLPKPPQGRFAKDF